MKKYTILLQIVLLGALCASCFTVPAITGYDPETNTLRADAGAVDEQVEEYLASKGITVERIDAVDEKIKEINGKIYEAAEKSVGFLPIDPSLQILLLTAVGYLTGKGGLKAGQGVLGRLAKRKTEKA